MSARRFNFNNLTDAQLADIEAKFPQAVQTVTIKKPVYRILSMLLQTGVEVPHCAVTKNEPVAAALASMKAEAAAQNAKAAASKLELE